MDGSPELMAACSSSKKRREAREGGWTALKLVLEPLQRPKMKWRQALLNDSSDNTIPVRHQLLSITGMQRLFFSFPSVHLCVFIIVLFKEPQINTSFLLQARLIADSCGRRDNDFTCGQATV